ncbi:MAG TPA: zf-HC2 domain-containing protein [Terracidiphilus sp.]|jgi:hypothetical protein
MNPNIQSGMHPDADTLTAFAEQLLPANEREQILAHAAECSRCREVIFLAQQAAAGEPVTAALPSSTPEKMRTWWLGGSRWAWIPVGALAGLIGVAVVLHFQTPETGMQLAKNKSSGEAIQQTPAQPSSPSLATNNPQSKGTQAKVLQENKPEPVRDDRRARQNEEVLDQKRATAKQKDMVLGSAAPPIALSPGVVAGSIHGVVTARAQSTPYDGPTANQLQQNAMQQNATQQNVQPQQNVLQSAQRFDRKPAENRIAANQSPAPASETVTVQAEAAKATPPAAPSPAPPPQLSDELTRAREFEISPAATAQLKKAAKIALPGGAQPLSVAFAADRTIAIDTSGALFLSEDQGKHWHPVATQWTGRAVLVRNLQQSKDKAGYFKAGPAVRFELVNDKLQSWKSPDGSTWTAETTPNK